MTTKIKPNLVVTYRGERHLVLTRAATAPDLTPSNGFLLGAGYNADEIRRRVERMRESTRWTATSIPRRWHLQRLSDGALVHSVHEQSMTIVGSYLEVEL